MEVRFFPPFAIFLCSKATLICPGTSEQVLSSSAFSNAVFSEEPALLLPHTRPARASVTVAHRLSPLSRAGPISPPTFTAGSPPPHLVPSARCPPWAAAPARCSRRGRECQPVPRRQKPCGQPARRAAPRPSRHHVRGVTCCAEMAAAASLAGSPRP